MADPEETSAVEHHVCHRNGDRLTLEPHGSGRIEAAGVDGLVVNARDVTERVERKRELERRNERLTEFATRIAPRIRNPLKVISGGDDGFYVEDDGPGIPPEEREQVFEHGYSTSGGVGVGLTIARTRSWSIEVTDPEAFGTDEGGARFVVSSTGVE